MMTKYKASLLCLIFIATIQGCTTLESMKRTTPEEQTSDRASEGTSESAASQLRRAAIHQLELGNTEMASSQLERSLRIEPDSIQGYYQLARVRVAQGFYSEAKHLANKARNLIDSQGIVQSDIMKALGKLLQRIAVLEQP